LVVDEREGGNRDEEEKGMKGEETIPENNMEIEHGGAGIGNKNRELEGKPEIDEEDHSGRGKEKEDVGVGRLGINGVQLGTASKQPRTNMNEDEPLQQPKENEERSRKEWRGDEGIISYWTEMRRCGEKKAKDMNDEERHEMKEMIEATAKLATENSIRGVNMNKRMELMYRRMATSLDDEMENVMEERITLNEDLHLAELIEKMRNDDEDGGIWNDTKVMIMKMDGGNTEIRVKMARRNTKYKGIKGVRDLLDNIRVIITLDDRRIGMRNIKQADLVMPGKRYSRPSMIKQDGSMDTITFGRLIELADKEVVIVGIRDGGRMRGYRIMGKVLEEAIPEILQWIVEGYEYSAGKNGKGDEIWGDSMSISERREMVREWEKGFAKFKRAGQGRKAMKEYMERRKKGLLPRTSSKSAPGAGGIFWYYNRVEDNNEEGNEENDLETNEIAENIMKAIEFGGTEPLELTKKELNEVQKVGRDLMKHSSAQMIEDPYEMEINRDDSTWTVSLSNKADIEEGDFDDRLYDFVEDMEIWLELNHIKEKERINPVNFGYRMTWNKDRDIYRTDEVMGIWSLKDLCKTGCGAVSMYGGPLDGKHYRVERGIVQGIINEMISLASARLEWQNIVQHGEPTEEEESEIDEEGGEGEDMGENGEEKEGSEEEEEGEAEEDDAFEMTDDVREKLYVKDEMEECEDVKEWMTKTKKGTDNWISIVVDVMTGGGFRLTKQHQKFSDHLRCAEREGTFWYARWGIYNILAAKEGTESAVRMRKVKKLLDTTNGVKLKRGFGRLFIDTSEDMEEVWMNEFTNMMINRNGGTEEEVGKALITTKEEREDEYYRKKKRYAILTNIVEGCIVPPDELEHMRRDEEDGIKGKGQEWRFWRWDEWLLASRDEWIEGVWNVADKMIQRMRFAYVGPRTHEYGEAEEYSLERGIRVLSSLNGNGEEKKEGRGTVKEEWALNERIKITGLGDEPMNGTFLGEVSLRVKGVWKEGVEERKKQLKEGVTIEMKMHRIIGKWKIVSKENIDIDFNEDKGDILERTTADRAGDRGLELGRLEILTEKREVIVGMRQEGQVVKIKINSTALRDMWDQINQKCDEWAGGIHTWGGRANEVNSVKNEEDINNLNEDVAFQAKGAFVYGFTEESTKKLKNETMVEIIMGIAKMGLKGDVNCKRMELEKRIIEKEHKINTNNLGIYGGKEAKFGVMVEFFSYIRVGITGGMGIMVYDGRKYEVEGERMQLTRQYMSDKEMEIMKRATAGKQDNMIVAARGMTYKTPLDDVLRRSFKTYLEEELRVKIHVWIMQLRHLDERGKMRDETIMMGVVAEGAGSRMARSIEVFKKGQKKGMMMMEGIDIQLFRDSKEI
jgi:hypothetical protein